MNVWLVVAVSLYFLGCVVIYEYCSGILVEPGDERASRFATWATTIFWPAVAACSALLHLRDLLWPSR